MEEALLKRLKETINMRLAWALKLQSMIQHGAENGVKLEETDPGACVVRNIRRSAVLM